MNNVIVTDEGLLKLKEELKDLETNRRPIVIERIQAARSLGDLSENSEYDDARNEQSFVEGRIRELRDMIKHAKVMTKKASNGIVDLGSIIECQIEDDKETYELVGSAEADPIKGKISIDSPLGRELIGKKQDDKIIVNAPAGRLTYEIVTIK